MTAAKKPVKFLPGKPTPPDHRSDGTCGCSSCRALEQAITRLVDVPGGKR